MRQPGLQLGDVVARDEMTGRICEHPIAELPAGFLETPIGIGADNAVDREPALLLKCPDGGGNHHVVIAATSLVEKS